MSETVADMFEGYLECKLKKKWKLRFVIVNGSTLYYYKTELDDKPEGSIELAGLVLNADPKDKLNEHKNSFHITVGSTVNQFKTSADAFKLWIDTFEKHCKLTPQSAPSKTLIKKSKRSLMDKITRNTVASVGGSGSASFVMNDEMNNLLKAIEKLIEIDAGKEEAKKYEKFIMKLVAKCYMEWQHKNISNEQIYALDKPLRNAFTMFDQLFRYFGLKKAEYLQAGFKNLVDLLNNEIKTQLIQTLRPCLSPKNLSKLRDLFSLFFNVEFFERVWSKTDPKDEVSDHLFNIVQSMNQYNSFPLNLPERQ
ncbi:PH domain containing protein [Entamoeba histolytica HM-1:IMSS]|uniref:PH domain containing protein n=4 Tax=Entamoeba TaxID=5758 RepID=C4LTE4_ENTH1|nr:hypothetical protein ENU1_075140 [Entamoeba nuttalli P19]XP_657308.1 PH domain containing protein [Entamoeba histolytica HM-1:IMSS]BAN37831.1 PH domain containing protein [Entamoeba histolytica]EAL51929.1 PH domain containing protein [Entamoeba histolytica HM-1:IMSS]EKE40921.1 hypothetical protein ENU1_075140 [Entamoeba nuttalli P19]BAN39847.1 PH domain containing protein [Entamoeba histolytica]|eukprot:XP_008856741.1 hypothetical protein ENU1_075140 [Entamoeba nuttalli P19]